MEKLCRRTAPKFKTIDKLEILKSEKHVLSNGIPVHVIKGGSQDLVKAEFIFDAGFWHQTSPLVASLTNAMLNQGTNKYSAAEIAEKLDFYGAFTSFSVTEHEASVALFSLNKHLCETLKMMEHIIKNSIFPEKEFKIMLANKKEKFKINLQKTSILAKRKFNSLLYGENHPYAKLIEEADFNQIKLEQLKQFYRDYYTENRCKIMLSGKVEDSMIHQLENLFGAKKTQLPQENIPETRHQSPSPQKQSSFVCKKDAVQACIIVGKPTFTLTHKDYPALYLFNLLLGGYFGSRLMQNIREDKAYTYGIGSYVSTYPKGAHFEIATEVGTDVCKNAVQEIFKEIKRLREELVPEKELQLVKNYALGAILRQLDNPFSVSESLRKKLLFGLNNSYYEGFIGELKTLTSLDIRQVAKQYFREEDLHLVVCGPESCQLAIE